MTAAFRSSVWKRLALGVFALAVLAAPAVVGLADTSESEVWGQWPLLPWNDRQVTADNWADLLNRGFDLSRKGQAGQCRRYDIRRTNLTLDRKGQVVSRMVAEGRVARTLLREIEPGLWAERIEWQRFAAGQSQGPLAMPTPQELESARGLAYEFSPRSFDYVNIPGDFARLEDPLAGYLMKVLAMDFSGFDAIILGLRDTFADSLRIGNSQLQPRWREPTDITKVDSAASAGRYHLGEMRTELAGLTRCAGQPCALIWCSAEGNEVSQDIATEQLAIRMHGVEYFRAALAVSLLDGHLVAGEIWGPLQCVMELGFGGQPPQEQSVGAIFQQISVREIPEP